MAGGNGEFHARARTLARRGGAHLSAKLLAQGLDQPLAEVLARFLALFLLRFLALFLALSPRSGNADPVIPDRQSQPIPMAFQGDGDRAGTAVAEGVLEGVGDELVDDQPEGDGLRQGSGSLQASQRSATAGEEARASLRSSHSSTRNLSESTRVSPPPACRRR